MLLCIKVQNVGLDISFG